MLIFLKDVFESVDKIFSVLHLGNIDLALFLGQVLITDLLGQLVQGLEVFLD